MVKVYKPVDPVDYNEIVRDDERFQDYERNTLPIDEWNCDWCDQRVGYSLHEGGSTATLEWRKTYASGHALAGDTTFLCGECGGSGES